MADPEKIAEMKLRNWPQILLVVSLGVNLLIVGLVVGAVLRGGPPPPPHRPPADRSFAVVGLRGYVRSLSETDHEALRRDIDKNKDRIQVGREAIRQHLSELAQSLRTQPFDAQAVQLVLDSQRTVVSDNISLGHHMLMSRIAIMTDAERQQFADRLEADDRHNRESHRGPDQRPP